MLTDDEKRELIAEAERLVRQSAAGGNPVSEFGVTKEIAFVRGVRFAAEALEGALTADEIESPEWEYGMQDCYGLSHVGTIAEAYDHANRQDPALHPRPVRRRKAGPWMPVEEVGSNG